MQQLLTKIIIVFLFCSNVFTKINTFFVGFRIGAPNAFESGDYRGEVLTFLTSEAKIDFG